MVLEWNKKEIEAKMAALCFIENWDKRKFKGEKNTNKKREKAAYESGSTGFRLVHWDREKSKHQKERKKKKDLRLKESIMNPIWIFLIG